MQEGLAAQLDFQAIIDLVGDKIREIFGTADMSIALLDRRSELMTMPYYLEHGERLAVDAFPLGVGMTGHIIRPANRWSSTTITGSARRSTRRHRSATPAPTDVSKSYLGVPILSGDEALGVIALYGNEENAVRRRRASTCFPRSPTA